MKDCNRVNINVPMTIRKFYLCSWTCEMCNLMLLLSILIEKNPRFYGVFCLLLWFQFLIEQFWYLIFISCTRKCKRNMLHFVHLKLSPFSIQVNWDCFHLYLRRICQMKFYQYAFLIHYYIWQNLQTFTYHNRNLTSFVII